jgi:hypothetical protein
VLGPDVLASSGIPEALSSNRSVALAYVGPGPGLEFTPYFFILLAFAGAALSAVLQWPFRALYRLLFRPKAPDSDERMREPDEHVSESSNDGL